MITAIMMRRLQVERSLLRGDEIGCEATNFSCQWSCCWRIPVKHPLQETSDPRNGDRR